MGKKTDRILELEAEVAGLRGLLGRANDQLKNPSGDEAALAWKSARDHLNTVLRAAAGYTPTVLDSSSGDGLPDRALDIDRANSSVALSRDRDVEHTSGVAIPMFQGLVDIASELDVDVHGHSMHDAIDMIRRRILQLKNPSGDVATDASDPNVSKGDSLAEAMRHNAGVSLELESELRRNRGIVSRVAAAMQVGQWDADGTELVEKAQRWDRFKHRLRTDIRTWRARADICHPGVAATAIADELQAILAQLISTKEMAKWLDGKPATAVTDQVMSVVETPPPHDEHLKLTGDNVYMMCIVLGDEPLGLADVVPRLFSSLRYSHVARAEFLNLMNLVIVPIIARQGALAVTREEGAQNG